MSEPRIVCVGNVVRDEVFYVDVLPSAGIKIDVLRYEERLGGPAATAAVAIAHLGGRADYWGRIGKDAIGDAVLRALTRHNVNHSGVIVYPDGRTTRAVVTVDRKGERSIMVDRLGLPGDAVRLLTDIPDDTSVVLADTRWPAGAAAVLDNARDRRLPCVLDADGGSRDAIAALIEKADHVIFSVQGITELAGEGRPIDQLRRVAYLAPRTLAVTCGAEGSVWLIGGEITVVPAIAVTVRDTTGCGDVFHGAYALALGEGQSVLQSARFATATAALKAARGNGWEGMPGRRSVLEILSRENVE
jgi:sulfofructose kinase